MLYERALRAAEELTPDATAIAQVAESLGDVCEVAARYDRAESAYAQAASLAPTSTAKARLLRKRGIVGERTGNYDQAAELYEQALAIPEVDDEEMIELELAQAILEYRRGNLEQCVELTERASARAKAAGYQPGLARAYYVRAAAEGDRGGPAGDFLQLGLAVYEEIGDIVGIGIVVNNLGVRAYYEGHWNEASAHYAQARELAQRAGHVVMVANVTNNEGEIRLDQGAYDDARALLDDALRAYRAAGFAVGAALATANLGRLAARTGDFAEAKRLLQEAMAGFEAIGSGSFELEARARLAETFVFEGDHANALETATASLQATVAAGEVGVRNAMLERLIGYALLQARDPEAARPHFDESLRIARELDATLRGGADTPRARRRGRGVGGGRSDGAADPRRPRRRAAARRAVAVSRYGQAEGELAEPAVPGDRRDGRRPRPSTRPSCGPGAPGPRACRGREAAARRSCAIAAFSRRIGASVPGQPLFHGSTSHTATRSPSPCPRSTIAARLRAASSIEPALRDVVDPALHDQHVRALDRLVEAAGDLVGALAPDHRSCAARARDGAAPPSAPTGSRGFRPASASPSAASPR